MWLLNASTLQLVNFTESSKPRYTFLSHTWSNDEVSFQDMYRGEAQTKDGFHKILSACEQSQHDGFVFTWIDTRCIDKSSSAELSEAIYSMSRWYAEASVCYAYLSDISDLYDGDEPRMDSFTRSRYLVRGWTLQELIAPPEVEFFDRSWQYVNSRSSAARQIALTTGIDISLLCKGRGNLQDDLASYTVAERLSWAARRQTTRLEDRAYCLLGLFGVSMPLLYGKGNGAFYRLQEVILKTTADLSILA